MFKIIQYFVFVVCILPFCVVAQQPTIQANATQGCAPLSVSFSSNLSPSTAVLWEFGNGNSSTLHNPQTIYHNGGKYTIKLTVGYGSSNAQTYTFNDFISVYAKPNADFEVLKNQGCFPFDAVLKDKSTQGSAAIVSYDWDLGYGFTGNGKTDTILINRVGSYGVTLLITDANQCKATLTKTNQVTVWPKPTANFTSSANSACQAPATFQLNNTSSTANGSLIAHTWYFQGLAAQSTTNPSISFQNEGTFWVALVVKDNKSCSDSIIKPGFFAVGKPKADFVVNDPICLGDTMQFEDASSQRLEGMEYEWIFPDTIIRNVIKPSYVFRQIGNQTVTLKIKTKQGCSDSIIKTNVRVSKKPNPFFSATDTLGCSVPHQFNIRTYDPSIVKWNWQVGSYLASGNNAPFSIYNQGKVDAAVWVTDNNGCTNSLKIADYMYVSPSSIAPILDKSSGCVPLDISFSVNKQGSFPLKSVHWDFGNGESASATDTIYTFKDTGDFRVHLKVEDEQGCVLEAIRMVRVGVLPAVPDFTADKREGCHADMRVQFTNLTAKTPVSIDRFEWQFGNNPNKVYIENPLVQFSLPPGWHDVTLTVFNRGCARSITKSDFIRLYPALPSFVIDYDLCRTDSAKILNFTQGGHIFDWLIQANGTTYRSNDYQPDIKILPGYVAARLTVTDTVYGCVNTQLENITLPATIINGFTNTKDICPNDYVSFRNLSLNYDSLVWELSDGRMFFDKNPLVLFDKPGVYDMRLSLFRDGGICTKTLLQTEAVVVHETHKPIGISNTKGCVPLTVNLVDSTFDTSGKGEGCWYLGNGDTLKITQKQMYYTYRHPAAKQSEGFVVSHHFVNEFGCGAIQNFNVLPSKPKIAFEKETLKSCTFPTYRFGMQDAAINGLEPLKYNWQIGSEITTQATLSKLFDKEGLFKVALSVTDGNNCTSSDSFDLNIKHRNLRVDFVSDKTAGNCPPLLVQFSALVDTGYAAIARYEWDFGDNTQAFIANPGKSFLLPGSFDVSLRVIDKIGCEQELKKSKLINLGGPTGSISLSPKDGCVPLGVGFEATTQNAKSVIWDTGDGNRVEGKKINHSYERIGSYLPSLILSDGDGCTSAIPAAEPIVVHPIPIPDFSFQAACSGDESQFINLSNSGDFKDISTFNWDFGNGNKSSLMHPKQRYLNPGNYVVTLTVVNKWGCSNNLQKQIVVPGALVNIEAIKDYACLGTPMQFEANIQTFLCIPVQEHWDFGDGTMFYGDFKPTKHSYHTPGEKQIIYTLYTNLGCTVQDTLFPFPVGDTLVPTNAYLYAVSVANDFEVRLHFKAEPHYDFLSHLIYRFDFDSTYNLITEIKDKSKAIFFDKVVNTRFNVYRYFILKKNLCELVSPTNEARVHASMELLVSPDTNKNQLKWTPYVGWDKIDRYQVQKQKDGIFQTIASLDGQTLFYEDTAVFCSQTENYRILAEGPQDFQISLSDSSKANPKLLNSISQPKLSRVSVENDNEITVDVAILPKSKYELTFLDIFEVKDNGNKQKRFSLPLPDAQLSQAFPANTFDRPYTFQIALRDLCDASSPFSDGHTSMHLRVDANQDEKPLLLWTDYKGWNVVKKYEIHRLDDGSFSKIAEIDASKFSFEDHEVALNGRANYCYKILAVNAENNTVLSWSNYACMPAQPRIFVPNAFTPNNDNLNPFFIAKGVFIQTFTMRIFNRWGELLYVSHDMNLGWDGTYKGEKCQQDVYAYLIETKGSDGKLYTQNGSFTLMR